MRDKTQTIIIVGGCGTIGLSTAWHLSRRGYTNIVCLDRWMFPSRSSAGFDRNKIVRAAYSDPLYARLALEAIEQWKQPLFKGIFFQSGWIVGTLSPPSDQRLLLSSASNAISASGEFDRMLHVLKSIGADKQVKPISSPSELNQTFSEFLVKGPNFRGIFDKNAGWVDAAQALQAVGRDCVARGVRFYCGSQGTVKSIIKSPHNPSKVVGVLTEDGTVWEGEKIVLCAGSYSDTLIDMEGQVTAVAYSTTHVALTADEQERYRNMPVIFVEGLGYTFPPDKTGCIKFCDLHVGHPWYHHTLDRSRPVSIPRDPAYHQNDVLAEEDVAGVKKFIEFCMPQFKDRPFLKTAMSWDAEAFDFGWIIGPHPSSPKHLFLATAGSGHTFKNLPNIGRYVADSLEGILSPELQETWRWRPDKVNSVAPIQRVDLAKLNGWKPASSGGSQPVIMAKM